MSVFKKYLPNIVINLIAGGLAPIAFFVSLILMFGLFQPPSTKEVIQGVLLAAIYIVLFAVGQYFVYKKRNKEMTSLKLSVFISIISFVVGGFLTWMYFYFSMS